MKSERWKQHPEALRHNLEQRRSNAASKHKNKSKYSRKQKHRNQSLDN